jgi:hypothetical protein
MLIVAGLHSQTQQLPEIKIPDISSLYKPTAANGWVGQYVYELKFNDSTSVGKGKHRKYRHVIINRTNTGFVELTMKAKGAIRSNQPDKYNEQRYESWINQGSKTSWNKHNYIDTAIDPSATMLAAVDNPDAVTGRMEKYSYYSSGDNWLKGRQDGTDLQIDYTTGKYSFIVPTPSYEIEGDETMVKINYKPEKREVIPKKEKRKFDAPNSLFLNMGEWYILEGVFTQNQKEIIIRERIPLTLYVTMEQGTKTVKSAEKKGFVDFYLVLRRAPFADKETGSKSASSDITPSKKEPAQEKTTEESNEDKTHIATPVNETPKNVAVIDSAMNKRRIGSGIRNKVNGIIRKKL